MRLFFCTYRYQSRPSGKCLDESKKCISFDDTAIDGCMERNLRRARVPHFFTPIIIACGRFFEFVTSVDDDDELIVENKQRINSTKIIPLRQLK